MKKIFAVVLTLCMLMTVSFAMAEGTAPGLEVGNTVTAMGNASVTIVPDFATIVLGVHTQEATGAEAQRQNATQMNAVIEALVVQGIAREDMQTNYFGINPIYDYSYSSLGGDGDEKLVGYRVENNLTVTIRDLNTISAVLDAAMAAGANQSYGLNFDSTKRGEAYDRALAQAVKEGKRKAEILASAAEGTLGEMLSATEQTAGYSTGYEAATGLLNAKDATPIMNGTLTVQASVVVTYRVE